MRRQAARVAAIALLAGALVAGAFRPAHALDPVETPMLEPLVKAGALPPVAERLPQDPLVVHFKRAGAPSATEAAIGAGTALSPGRQGGDLTMLVARDKDTRLMYSFGYARLVTYDQDLQIVPDILKSVDVQDGRVFTLHLRPGMRWSDGAPFTTDDFRFWWQDVANNKHLSPYGPPVAILVDGEKPQVDIIDTTTIRYSWSHRNPFFLPALAGAQPLQIYAPAHYLKQFLPRYADPATLKALVAKAHARNWAALFIRKGHHYDMNNPDLPTLQPWVNTTAAPAERFVFVRNPYYFKVDELGRQLPYIDRVYLVVADSKIIPAKTGAGESDLQWRYLHFDNYTFLKAAEARNDNQVRLWRSGYGSRLALFPNLTASDPVWRKLLRDVRFRRALSVGIDREEINQVIYYGLARPSNDTVVHRSPLWREDFQTRWAQYDPKLANQLLDEIGLTRRNGDGIRLMPDGRPLELVVETAGESTEEVDVLQLIADSWRALGIKLLIKPSQPELLRDRVFSGATVMSIGRGLDSGLATPDMSPAELVPDQQDEYQWPKWGEYIETKGKAGEAPDTPVATQLLKLMGDWQTAPDEAGRREAWLKILALRASQVLTIGLVNDVPVPMVVRNTLHNVPSEGVLSWMPGSLLGIYQPDTFWLDGSATQVSRQ